MMNSEDLLDFELEQKSNVTPVRMNDVSTQVIASEATKLYNNGQPSLLFLSASPFEIENSTSSMPPPLLPLKKRLQVPPKCVSFEDEIVTGAAAAAVITTSEESDEEEIKPKTQEQLIQVHLTKLTKNLTTLQREIQNSIDGDKLNSILSKGDHKKEVALNERQLSDRLSRALRKLDEGSKRRLKIDEVFSCSVDAILISINTLGWINDDKTRRLFEKTVLRTQKALDFIIRKQYYDNDSSDEDVNIHTSSSSDGGDESASEKMKKKKK